MTIISPGTVLGGRYRLEERIASGGMGDVWRAVDDVLGRTVAVKILLPALLDEPGFAERFRWEARTMATINHPGVVDIYDYGSDGSAGAYLVMEYVEGDALSRTLARVGRLTPARTMALVAQAADALHAAHEKGIVHRDVKPGNLLVRPNGTLVLTDFGIARSAGAAQLTAAGSVLGTASYISAEQAMGQQATALSDIYALGVVAYQCLAGRRPFEGENPLEIAMRHVRETPPPLPPDIPPQVRDIVHRAMAKDPAARWPSAAAFAAVARRAAAALAAAHGSPTPLPASPGPVGPAHVSPGGAPPGTPVPAHPPMSPAHPPASPAHPPMSPARPPASPAHPPASPVGVARPGGPVPPGYLGAPVHPGSPVPPGYLGAPVHPGGPVPPGYLGGPLQPPKPPRTGLIVAIIIAVVVVAVCIGAAIAIAQNQDNASGTGDLRVVAVSGARSHALDQGADWTGAVSNGGRPGSLQG